MTAKKIISTFCATCMLMGTISSAHTASLPAASPLSEHAGTSKSVDVRNVQPPTSMVWDGTCPYPDIDLFENASYWYQNDTIWNGRSTNSFNYRLDQEFQSAKIWVSNQSGGPITISSSYDGGEFGSGHTIENNDDKIIYIDARGNIGDFYLNINSDNGDILDGLISIKTGTKIGVGYPW